MKLTERIKQHPWLFGGVCGIPLIAHIGVLIWIATATNYSGPNTSEIPTYAWVLAFAILPVLSAIVSVAMTWFLFWCTGTAKYANTPLARLYGFVFAVPWILLFGYLGFFAFAMGLGSPPAPTSMTQFFNRIGLILVQFPIITLVLFAICAGTTSIFALFCELVRTRVLKTNLQ